MPVREVSIDMGEIHHIYNRSIAKFKIFNSSADYKRIIDTIEYYSIGNPPCKFSLFTELGRLGKAPHADRSKKLVRILAYCIMPTHLHLILEEIVNGGIAEYMKRIMESYTRYFNTKHTRKGPLWEGRFRNVLVESDEQLIHLTRYIHLNPVTDCLVNRPELWPYSSYAEYANREYKNRICNFEDRIDADIKEHYKEFVTDQIGYQRTLNQIKKHLFHAGNGI